MSSTSLLTEGRVSLPEGRRRYAAIPKASAAPKRVFWRAFVLSLLFSGTIAAFAHWIGLNTQLFGGDGYWESPYDGYLEIAAGVAQGKGFVLYPSDMVVTHRPPLESLLLAPITWLPPFLQRGAIVVLHSLLFGGACFFTANLGTRLFGHPIGRWSWLPLAVYPWMYWHIKDPVCTTLHLFEIALFFDLLVGGFLPDSACFRWRRAAALGLTAGAAILTHGTMLLTIPMLLTATGLFCWMKNDRERARAVFVAGAIAIVSVAPWTIRNYHVCGQFVPVATGAGLQYFYGNVHWRMHDRSLSRKRDAWERTLSAMGLDRSRTELLACSGWKDPAMDQTANRKMASDVSTHPARFVKKLVLNGVEFYFPIVHPFVAEHVTAGRRRTIENVALSAWHLTLWTIVAFSLWRWAPHRRRSLLLLAAVAALVAPFLPFIVAVEHGRYAIPTLPLLSVLAAPTIARLLAREGR